MNLEIYLEIIFQTTCTRALLKTLVMMRTWVTTILIPPGVSSVSFKDLSIFTRKHSDERACCNVEFFIVISLI